MTESTHSHDALADEFQRRSERQWRWLQRLAHGLVLDTNDADDLLQEAWLVAAGASPRRAPTDLAWFAGVLRNLARRGRRSAGRRREHESRAVAERLERGAASATSEERVARELHLLSLVAALPEPQRDAVVARYFDGLSPAAIARREGLSVDAVKSRLKRGLESLRTRLEREQNGVQGLALWLAPLARGHEGQLVSGGVLLAAGGVAAAALASVAAYGLWAPPRLGGAPSESTLAPEASVSPTTADSMLAVSPRMSASARVPAEPGQEPLPAATPKECRIHGRVVDHDGAPVQGARVVADGWESNEGRVAAYGLPPHWQDPVVLTDERGAFELRFVPPQAYQFTLELRHDAFADLGWRWSRLREGEERDLGTVVLPKPAVIVGHVEGPRGELLVGSWRVQASLGDGLPEHEGVATKTVAVDPATGSFRFDDLPPGQVYVEAIHARGDRTERRSLATTAGEATDAVLRFAGPDPSTSIRLTIAKDGLVGPVASQLAEGSVRAISADGEAYPFEPLLKRGWTYTTGALPPGPYHVEVDDGRFATWSQDGVRPGDSVRAQLAGRAKLRLTLLDPEGAPVPRYRLGVRPTEPVMATDAVVVLAAGAEPPLGGLFEGLLPGAVEVTLEVEGHPEWRGEVRGLADDAVAELWVQLSRPRPLAGRVVHSDGSPATNGVVEVTRGRVAGHGEPGTTTSTSIEVDGEWRSVLIPYRDASVSLAEDGSFDLGPLGGPRAVLRVRLGDWFCRDQDLALEGLELPLVVTLPPAGAILGAAVFDGDRPGKLMVELRRDGDARALGVAPCHVDEAGRFLLGPVLPGTYWVQLAGLHEAEAREADSGSGAGAPRVQRVRRRVDVAAGAPTECELDFGHPRTAGHVSVAVTFAGAPAPPGTTVRLEPTERFDALGYAVDSSAVTTEGDTALFARVAAGTYTLSVAGEPNWFRARAPEVRVRAGEATRVDFDVDVVRRTLRVVDAGGGAAANRRVGLCQRGSFNWLRPFTTDAEGELELAIPAGAYSLSGSFPEDPSLLADLPLRDVDWEQGEGALVVVLPGG